MHHSKYQIRGLAPLGLVTASVLALAVAGCNDTNVVTGPGDKDPVDPAGVATLEYFTGGYTGEGGLYAVPPSQPSAFVNVDAQADTSSRAYYTFGISAVVSAKSATPTSVEGLHVDSVVYPRRDGTLWRVSTDPSTFPPEPVRVSSANQIYKICMRGVEQSALYASPDVYANPDATPFVYVLPTADMGCEDALSSGNVSWHFVLAGDAAGIAPRDFPTPDPLVGDFDYSTTVKAGTVVNLLDAERNNAGWLIRKDGQLTRVSPDGTVAVSDIFLIAEAFQPVAPQLNSGVMLLAVDGNVMAFDPANNSLTALNGESGGPLQYEIGVTSLATTDGLEVYLVQEAALYRTTDGGRAVVKIDQLTGGESADYQAPFVGDDSVVWVVDVPGAGQTLRSVAKSAATAGTGEVIATFGDDALGTVVGNSSQWLFYTERDFSGGTTVLSAVALRLDGSAREVFANARWNGATLASHRTLGDGGSISRVYREDGVMGPGDSGDTLVSAPADNPADAAAAINLGTIPGGLRMFLPGFGPGRLTTASDMIEIAYFNDSQGSTLQVLPFEGAETPVPLPLF